MQELKSSACIIVLPLCSCHERMTRSPRRFRNKSTSLLIGAAQPLFQSGRATEGQDSMNLVREFLYRIVTTNPLPATTGSPLGEGLYAAIVEGEIEGPRLHASLAAPGSDCMGAIGD